MVNELQRLLQESSDNAPHDDFDSAALLRAGRSRNRRRRATVVGVVGLAAAAVVAVSTMALDLDPKADPATPVGPVTEPVGPVLTLSDATSANLIPVLQTANDLDDVATARFLDGVTADGQAVVRVDKSGQDSASLTLVDLATEAEEPLPDVPGPVSYLLEATGEHLVYSAEHVTTGEDRRTEARSLVFDRASETWREMRWPELPVGVMLGQDVGPDGRLYVAVNPEADAVSALNGGGLTGELWSVSLTDPEDVRDEHLIVGSFAIDDDHLVWSEKSNGISNRLTVRDLESGDEKSFDPQSGRYCLQSSLDVDADRIVMFQNCVTENGVTDDRIQVVSMTGEPVVTIQGDSITGSVDAGGHVIVTAQNPDIRDTNGAYSYDLTSGDFLRLSTGTPRVHVTLWGPVAEGYVMWTEGPARGQGWVQKIASVP